MLSPLTVIHTGSYLCVEVWKNFESQNRMLNVTKWSDSMPCYLNREIITLLSTLGVKDEVFEAMQMEQPCLLGKMLTNRDASLKVLEILNVLKY